MANEEINIQPKAGILSVFSRLNYKPWYAIGEFVDNSTASYFGHEKSMRFYKFNKLTVNVEYDAYKNTLTIVDDAFGMSLPDFKRAVLMDQEPDHLNGRNEFGMGLKTAASWFGKVWSVRSTQLGNTEEYYAEVNIPKLKAEGLNTITISKNPTDTMSHGTTIVISEITKKINAPKTKQKIRDLLSSMYRRDIASGKLDLYFNGEKLYYEPLKVLKFRNTEWQRQIDFSFVFDDKTYHVSGMVGIMEKGSYPKAGLALFRYDRVVIGGYDENYKPYEIYGQPQSQISLKLFGELNMEDFPVNQAKDGFVWDDGLEDEFLAQLKVVIKDYIDIASLSKEARLQEEEIGQERSSETEDVVQKMFENIVLDEDSHADESQNEEQQTQEETPVEQFIREQKESNAEAPDLESKEREYTIQLDPITSKTFKVIWQISGNDKWIDYDAAQAKITININHPFFKPYSSDNEFKGVLESFVVAFICAEELAKKASIQSGGLENYVLPSVFRSKMNSILKKISDR